MLVSLGQLVLFVILLVAYLEFGLVKVVLASLILRLIYASK